MADDLDPWPTAAERRARAKADEISAELRRLKDAIDIGDTDLSHATTNDPFREYAEMLREWADEIGRFDPARPEEEGPDHA